MSDVDTKMPFLVSSIQKESILNRKWRIKELNSRKTNKTNHRTVSSPDSTVYQSLSITRTIYQNDEWREMTQEARVKNFYTWGGVQIKKSLGLLNLIEKIHFPATTYEQQVLFHRHCHRGLFSNHFSSPISNDNICTVLLSPPPWWRQKFA